jgi:hypothetical protein
MYEAIVLLQTESSEHRVIWNTLGALAIGALLGVLVAVPYDRLFGLSVPLYTVLRSLIATATLVSVRAMDRAELTFKADRLPPDRGSEG